MIQAENYIWRKEAQSNMHIRRLLEFSVYKRQDVPKELADVTVINIIIITINVSMSIIIITAQFKNQRY